MATITASALGGEWKATAAWEGAKVPGEGDDVILGASSGSITITEAAKCRSLDATSYAKTLTINTGILLSIGTTTSNAGLCLKLGGAMTFTVTSESKIEFVSTAAEVQKITTAGKKMPRVVFKGTGATWQLQDKYETTTASEAAIGFEVNTGTLETNGQEVVCGYRFNVGASGTLKLGASTVKLTGTGEVWHVTGTLEAGTSTIELTNATETAKTVVANGITHNSFIIASDAVEIGKSATFATLKLNTKGKSVKGTTIAEGITLTVTGALTANSTSAEKIKVKSSVAAKAWKIKFSESQFLNGLELQDSTAEGTGEWIAAHSTSVSGNSGWLFQESIKSRLTATFQPGVIPQLTALGTAIAAGTKSNGIAISGDGKSVYVGHQEGTSIQLFERLANGELKAMSPETMTTGLNPRTLCVSPDGKSVYVACFEAEKVYQFERNTETGALKAYSTAFVAAGSGPHGITISPDGKSVYCCNFSGATISQYERPASGELKAYAAPTIATQTNPNGLSVSPDGKSIYCSNRGSESISQYERKASGELTALSPATVTTGKRSRMLVVSEDGNNVYAPCEESKATFQYSRNSEGKLTALSPASVSSGTGPWGIATLNNDVYVVDNFTNKVLQFWIGAEGQLVPMPTAFIVTGSGPYSMVVSPDGKNAYVANETAATVSQYTRATARNPFSNISHGFAVALAPKGAMAKTFALPKTFAAKISATSAEQLGIVVLHQLVAKLEAKAAVKQAFALALTFAAKVASTGTLSKGFTLAKTLNASLAPKGTLIKSFLISAVLRATLTATGSVRRAFQIPRTFAAKVATTGSLNPKPAFERLTATLATKGNLARNFTLSRTLTASMKPTGVLNRTFALAKTIAAKLTPAGVISRNFSLAKTLRASVSAAGGLQRQTTKTLRATLAATGTLRPREAFLYLRAAIAPTTSLHRAFGFQRFIDASLSVAGSMQRKTTKRLTASLEVIGRVRKSFGVTSVLKATLALRGRVKGHIGKVFLSAVMGVTARVTRHRIFHGVEPGGRIRYAIFGKSGRAVPRSGSVERVTQADPGTADPTFPKEEA